MRSLRVIACILLFTLAACNKRVSQSGSSGLLSGPSILSPSEVYIELVQPLASPNSSIATPMFVISSDIAAFAAGTTISLHSGTDCSGPSLHSKTLNRDSSSVYLKQPSAQLPNIPTTYYALYTYNLISVCSEVSAVNSNVSYVYNGEAFNPVALHATCSYNLPVYSSPFATIAGLGADGLCTAEDYAASLNCIQSDGTFQNNCFATGTGSSNNPFLICTFEQLQELSDESNSHYELGRNLNALAPPTNSNNPNLWNAGQGFEPIGSALNPFSGFFNGNGFTISNLNLEWANTYSHVGIFGLTEYCGIQNLRLENIDLDQTSGLVADASRYSGPLLGFGTNYFLNAIQVDSLTEVLGTGHVGGVFGYLTARSNVSRIQSQALPTALNSTTYVGGIGGAMAGLNVGSESTFNLSSYNQNLVTPFGSAGGLLGNVGYTIVSESYVNGSVTVTNPANFFLGGFFSSSTGLILRDSYYSGTVSTPSTTWAGGGMIGVASDTTIERVYTSGSISVDVGVAASNGTGGIIGTPHSNSSLSIIMSHSFSVMDVSTDGNEGAIAGRISGSSGLPTLLSNWFFNSTQLVQNECVGEVVVGVGECQIATAYTDFHAQGINTLIGSSEWDFTSVWNSNAGTYPTLRRNP